jgi:long-chain fatty acid transport protein
MGRKIRVASTIVVASASVWALNKNQSVEFAQDLNRSASVSTDAASHNPAGLAFLPVDGLYLNVGSQTILQTRTIQEPTPLLTAYGQPEYQGDIHTWVFPTLQAAYRLGELTFFAHAGPLGGGGTGAFDQGLPQFDNMILGFANGVVDQVKAGVEAQAGAGATSGTRPTFQYKRDLSFEGDEMILGTSAGAAYRIIPTLSVAAAYRFSYASYAYKGTAKPSQLDIGYAGSVGGAVIDATVAGMANHVIDSLWKDVSVDVVSTGMAHGAVLGLDFKPDDIWNVGLRFEWNSELEIENETKTLSAPTALLPYLAGYADGAKSKITEPMVVAGGVSFKGIDKLTLESSWIYGFAEAVDRNGLEKDFHNSLMGGLGVRYQLLSTLELATGYSHDWTYYNDKARLESDGDLPTHYVSAGVGLQAMPRLKINGGAMWGIGQDRHGFSKASGARQNMSSSLLNFGLGLEWSPAI